VVPYLVEELLRLEPADRLPLLSALRQLGPETVPPLVAALDSDDTLLKGELIDVFQKRAAEEVVPNLWYLAASPTQPEAVRRKASAALASFLNVQASHLPPAKVALAREAERYFRHQVAFADPRAVTVWRWDGKGVVAGWPGAPTVTASQAEEYYGVRFAGQALALDPTYKPAQVVLLSLALEKGMERGGPDRPLARTDPAVHGLLASVSPDLLIEVLERALKEQRTPLILGAARALGERAEVLAKRPTGRGQPALVQALYYPDRRVQMAAAESLLRIPGPPAPRTAARVVEVLARALAAEKTAAGRRKVLVAVGDEDWRTRVRQAVEQAGAEAVPVETGRQAMRRLRAAADVDAVLLDSTLPDPGLASLLAQLRADTDVGRLPVLLAAVPESPKSQDLATRYRTARQRLGVITDSTRAYREALRALDEEHAARLRALKTDRLEAAAQAETIKLLEQQYDERRRLTAARFPEAVILLQDAGRLQRELRAVTADYAQEAALREGSLRRFAERYRNVYVVPANLFDDADALRVSLRGRVGEVGEALTDAELKEYAERAARLLAGLANEYPPGYDVRPAEEAILGAVRAGKLSAEGQLAAMDAASRLPGPRPQRELANVVLDGGRPLPVRVAAAAQLVRHQQQHSPTLTAAQVEALQGLYRQAGTDATLKANLALVMGALRPDARRTGERLRQYQPVAPLPPPKDKK
jgi:CheY-like chemotaxis protein